MTTTTQSTTEAAEIKTLASNIRTWQKSLTPTLSDAELIRRYPSVGSSKTYKAMHEGRLDGFLLSKFLPRYRNVWAQIEDDNLRRSAGEIYEDLTGPLQISQAVAGVMHMLDNTRYICIEGVSGSGKTTCANIIVQTYGAAVAKMTEATECWRSTNAALDDICDAIGISNVPLAGAQKLRAIIAYAKRSKLILIIDESHHMTAGVLNILKAIINRTSAVVITLGVGTLWQKLTARASEEAKQLKHNRLFEHITLTAPDREDTAAFLSRRCEFAAASSADIQRTASKIAELSRHNGCLKFINRVTDAINRQGGAITPSDAIETAQQIQIALKAS